jgi:putative membrane protein
MNWILALHVIAMVCWFAALFYLPRLYIYHYQSLDDQSACDRFEIMERRLYFSILVPSLLATCFFGYILLWHQYDFYRHQMWMHVKLISVILLVIYSWHCNVIRKQLIRKDFKYSEKFLRFYNEIPTLFLFIIVIMVVVKPWVSLG